MRRIGFWAAIGAVIVFALVVAARPTGPSTDAQRVASITAELRCPVCQGLSVADSDSETARNIRTDITRRVTAGETAAEIRAAYVARYGEWVLLRPERTGFTGLVWLIPPLAAAAGAAGLIMALWRWRHQRHYTPSEDDVERVARALERRG